MLDGVKRFILWDYARATWQYDVMVGLILAFIFLTPRDFFRDQPRPKNVVMVTSDSQQSAFLIEPELLVGHTGAAQTVIADKLIHSQPGGKKRTVIRVEAVFDDDKEIRGYLAYTKP